MEPKTIKFNARTQCGENLSSELYQKMQHNHEHYRQMSREYYDAAIDKNTEDHNIKATQVNLQKENGYS